MTPLSRDQLKALKDYLTNELPKMWCSGESEAPFYVEFARLIERAHGIK